MLPIPLIGQNSTVLPDGSPDPDHATDCGEACVSAVALAFGYGSTIGFSPGEVRRLIRSGWRDTSGLTTAQDLCVALWRIAQIPAHERDSNILQLHVESGNAFTKRVPLIVLGSWDGSPHWVVCCAVNKEGWLVMDPWVPTYRRISWQAVMAQYGGSYVHLDRSLSTVDEVPF